MYFLHHVEIIMVDNKERKIPKDFYAIFHSRSHCEKRSWEKNCSVTSLKSAFHIFSVFISIIKLLNHKSVRTYFKGKKIISQETHERTCRFNVQVSKERRRIFLMLKFSTFSWIINESIVDKPIIQKCTTLLRFWNIFFIMKFF